MIEVAVVLAIVAWIANLARNDLKGDIKSFTSQQSHFCLTCHAEMPDTPADYFDGDGDESRDRGAPLQEKGFDPATNCGDIITDYNILKTVVFRAVAGTAVQGITLSIAVCDKIVGTIPLGNAPQSGGVTTKSQKWSAQLYAGNYTLTILNANGTDMPNDGNLGDNQIGVFIDGFAIGELPMTLAQDSEIYNLIVNPD